MTFLAQVLPPRHKLWRGVAIAAGLWLFFMVATAYTSAVTLLDRVASTDVMRAASGGAWTSKIGWEVAYFLFAQILLHLVFAGLTWLLAVASAIVYPMARRQVRPHRDRLVLRARGGSSCLQRALVPANSDRRLLPRCRCSRGRGFARWPDRLLRRIRPLRTHAAGRRAEAGSAGRANGTTPVPCGSWSSLDYLGRSCCSGPRTVPGQQRRRARVARTS